MDASDKLTAYSSILPHYSGQMHTNLRRFNASHEADGAQELGNTVKMGVWGKPPRHSRAAGGVGEMGLHRGQVGNMDHSWSHRHRRRRMMRGRDSPDDSW